MEVSCSRKITDVQDVDIVVSGRYGHLVVSGVLNGSVVVKAPAYVRIDGIMNGDLLVEDGAQAEIRGMLNAESIVCNGTLAIHGVVVCQSPIPKTATLHSGCIVNSVQY
mgnify:FL=1